MKANINGVRRSVDALETDHGTRLTTLEPRVTKLEAIEANSGHHVCVRS
jgi:hypothetical protein